MLNLGLLGIFAKHPGCVEFCIGQVISFHYRRDPTIGFTPSFYGNCKSGQDKVGAVAGNLWNSRFIDVANVRGHKKASELLGINPQSELLGISSQARFEYTTIW